MKKMRLKIFFIFLVAGFYFLFSQANIFGQFKKNGGSVYSSFGIGDLNYSVSGRSDAMGVLGIGLLGNYSNSLNPAAWTGITNTRFSTDFNLSNINSSDGSSTAKRTYADFEGFNFAIPINKGNGWIFDAGLHTYSVVSYDITDRGSTLGENYSHIYSGEGGISRISLGFSYLLFHNFSFGLQFNYAFGTLTKENRIIWDNTALFNTTNSTTNSLAGYYLTTGLSFHGFNKLFKSKSFGNLNIAALFSTPMKMTSNISGRYDRSTGADTVNITDGILNLPLAFGFGISNQFKNNLVVAADIYLQNWDTYKYYGEHPAEFKNSMRVGAGFEYTPSLRVEDAFFSRASYRIGGYYSNGYLTIGGQPIKSVGVTAGVSLPLSRINAFDINFSYEKRGTTTNGLVLDNFYKLGIAVEIGEFWLFRTGD
jgi:hypothetical protein